MPKFYKQDLLSKQPSPESLLESPLDTPELPRDDQQAMEWEHQYDHLPQSRPEISHFEDHYGDLDPVKELVSWEAPSRPFRKKDRSFYTTAAILVILVSLIALLAGQVMLIGAVLALLFLVYVLNFVPPQEAKYRLSTQGVTVEEHFYHWQELDSFWFSKKDGHTLLHVLTDLRYPSMLILVLGEGVDEEKVKRIVARYLPFHEIAPKSLMDKWSESLQKHFPLENPHKATN
jgi:hypothetical protein